MIRRPAGSTLTDTPFPDTTLFRSFPALGPSRCRRSENDGEIADCIVARRDRTRPGCWQRSPPGLIRTNDIATPFAPYLQPANADGEREPKSRLGVLVRSEEHTSELQSLIRISYAVFCLKKKK